MYLYSYCLNFHIGACMSLRTLFGVRDFILLLSSSEKITLCVLFIDASSSMTKSLGKLYEQLAQFHNVFRENLESQKANPQINA